MEGIVNSILAVIVIIAFLIFAYKMENKRK